jgi:hypothetical protein
MTSETVNALADHLAKIDEDWRLASGYTGKPVHRRAYWRNMAARLLADSVKALAGKAQHSKLK